MNFKLAGLIGATFIAAIALLTGAGSGAASASDKSETAAKAKCEALIGFNSADTIVKSASFQSANSPVIGANAPSMTGQYGKGAPIGGLPEFCRITGSIHPEKGSDIRFETWLPTVWDGRFTGANSGGLAGFINYLDLAAAVRAGQATSGSDTGHIGDTPGDGRWAKGNPQKIRDYGWRAVHVTTVAGKALAEAFYGRRPDKSYFIGCSNGGRQGLMEASRFPDDYDGIVVGAPAVRLTDIVTSMANAVQAQSKVGSALRVEHAQFLQSEVLKQCDGTDGQIDGLLGDPRQCRFDYSKLSCEQSTSPQCMNPAQISALKRINNGVVGNGRRPLAYGFPLNGGEVGKPVAQFGWETNVLTRFKAADGGPSLGDSILENFTAPSITTSASFDFKRDGERLRKAVGGDLDSTPDLTRFFARGGKIILWHGWSDAILPPQWSIDLHRDILMQSGPKAKGGLQFFMMPGVQHCAGGPGADAFGQIGAAQPKDTAERSMAVALQEWVEKGRAPQSFIGRRNGIMSMYAPGGADKEQQRLHCAWPKKAVLQIGGNPDRAASYTCK
jgi:Tannase and feruloyl esterase